MFIANITSLLQTGVRGGDAPPLPNPVAPVILTASMHTHAENTDFVLQLESDTPGSTFSLAGGLDAAEFVFDGIDTFTLPSPNFEAPTDSDGNNTYSFIARNSIDTGEYSEKTFVVTITDVVEGVAPTFLSPLTYNQIENVAFSQVISCDQNVTFSKVGGGDQAVFTITPASASSTTLAMDAQDYEVPDDANLDRVYRVRLRATNVTTGLYVEGNFDITITNEDEGGAEVATLVAAMSTPPSSSDEAAYAVAIAAMKAEGIWTDLDWFNIALHDEQAGNLNWKNPGTSTGQRATKTGTVNFVAYEGWTSNGIDGVMSTGIAPGTKMLQDDSSMGIRIHALSGSVIQVIGNTKARITVGATGLMTYRAHTAGDMTGVATGSSTPPLAYAWSRDGASAARSYFQGAGETASTTVSSAINTAAITFCAVGALFSSHTVQCCWFGAALTQAQHAAMESIITTLLASLGGSTPATALLVDGVALTVDGSQLTVT
jgi:hypothetical protein